MLDLISYLVAYNLLRINCLLFTIHGLLITDHWSLQWVDFTKPNTHQ
ncbi:hypothetical protein [Dactylococcopsis salina]|nr:hypothetical protein [Dactylococcopsis salina]